MTMQQIPILSGIWDYLTAPNLPNTSLSISETHVALIALKKKGREVTPRNLGVLRLPDGLIQAGFNDFNIHDEADLSEHLQRAAAQAGLKRVRSLSVTLPAGTARSLIVTFDALPNTREEIEQTIAWKVERSVGQRLSELRISHRRLKDMQGRPQWIASAVREDVATQYERVFAQLKWRVGMIAPEHLGEAQWLMRQELNDDQAVISLNPRGFVTVIARGAEPILVREVECSPEERENELYRLMLFYRDRLVPADSAVALSRVLIIGEPSEQRRLREVTTAALERQVIALDPAQLGLNIEPNAPFHHFAAASGLATMAWG